MKSKCRYCGQSTRINKTCKYCGAPYYKETNPIKPIETIALGIKEPSKFYPIVGAVIVWFIPFIIGMAILPRICPLIALVGLFPAIMTYYTILDELYFRLNTPNWKYREY